MQVPIRLYDCCRGKDAEDPERATLLTFVRAEPAQVVLRALLAHTAEGACELPGGHTLFLIERTETRELDPATVVASTAGGHAVDVAALAARMDQLAAAAAPGQVET